jgi:hypothetical protein
MQPVPALPSQPDVRRAEHGHRQTGPFRSEQDRSRSVRRRADPLHRRVGRFLAVTGILVMLAVGAYAGVRALDDWMQRDRLPELGAELPPIRATTFDVASEAPAPDLDGTLTLDAQTGAFEFVGRDGGRHSGIHVVSSDGSRVVLRRDGGAWRTAGEADTVANDAATAAAYLAKSDGVETILPGLFRRHVELVQQTTERTADSELERYDLLLDTEAMSRENLLEWTEFQRDAIPGVEPTRALPITIWVDADDVVVRLAAGTTGWRWVRLAHLAEPFVPVDPVA